MNTKVGSCVLFFDSMLKKKKKKEAMTRLQAAMKEGFSGIMATRVANSVTSPITSLQYDMNMKCTRVVHVDGDVCNCSLVEPSKIGFNVSGSDGDDEDEEDSTLDEVHRRKVVDPIRWFGFLPHSGMRHAEASFKKALSEALVAVEHLMQVQSSCQAFHNTD